MNITELDQYNLKDAVKFHDRLNPRIWGRDEHLLPEVTQKLLAIAADFQEFLGVPDLDVIDITVSGSNAAYSYTPNSDIDLHLVVRMPDSNAEVYQELFNAKKYQYNDEHDIRIGGADVELYVQPADQKHHSQGIYSVRNGEWQQVPSRRKARVDDDCVRHKTEDLSARIQQAIASNDEAVMQRILDKIKRMRQAGLEQQGEFGCDNLVFKMLRQSGLIDRLRKAKTAAHDRALSLQERKRKKKSVRYGFGGYWYPGFAYGGNNGEGGSDGGGGESMREGHQGQPYSSEDGVAASTQMFLNETDSDEQMLQQFIEYTANQLGIEHIPKILLHRDDDWGVENHSFGRYDPDAHALHVNLAGRHIMDILRTTAHELAHCRQHELSPLPDTAGDTGSPWENQAHATAGAIMRDWADQHPEMFDTDTLEEATGYIPKNSREAQDPRFSMAITGDIKPGEVGRQANRLGLKTGRNGEPGLLMKTANLRESKVKDLNEPPGPESPPTMPRGTVRVDVSDMYDWYKLGRDFGNLDRADVNTYGKGPPSTIVSFGDEDTEHKYIKNLQRLGLTTTDIDPVDPDQPPDMPRQKTDPTYNVAEGKMAELDMDLEDPEINDGQFEKIYGMTRKEARELFSKTNTWDFPDFRDPNRPLHEQGVAEDDLVESLRQEFELLESEFIGEIKMSPTNLRAEAAKTGALAGMEFEMIVPGVKDEDFEPDAEPDYDYDERCRSIEDAVQFFHDGDYNSRRDVERLRDAMTNDYNEWLSEQLDEDWDRNAEDYIYQYLVNNKDPKTIGEIIGQDLSDADGVDKQQAALAAELVKEKELQPYYDAARDFHREETDGNWDESDWLDSQDIDLMSGVENAYTISWPHWNYGDGESEADINAVAADFSDAVGMPVNASSQYHGGRREAGHYVVEPDGSLQADNEGDLGLEFVSPPMPIDEMLDQLKMVKAWAGRYGCYTNRSTGLHINISVPEFSNDRLDYVKLALLLGDEYVLKQFGRSSNTYAKSAMSIVRDKIKSNPSSAQALLDKMRGHMEDLATKAIHSGQTSKYTSINTKTGYIEFRSPGGDWLDENFDKVENTLLRFTVALKAAMDPEAYRTEYLKKLYQLLEPTANSDRAQGDTIKHFADYVAGKIPRAALRSFVKQAQLQRRVAQGKSTGRMWWRVGLRSNPNYSIEVVGSNSAEAISAAMQNDMELMRYNKDTDFTTEPVRPYDSSADTGAANSETATVPPMQTDYENLLGWDSQMPGANYEVVDLNSYEPVFLYQADSDTAAQNMYERWLDILRHDSEDYGFRQRAQPGSTLDIQRRRAAQSAQSAVQAVNQSQSGGRIPMRYNNPTGRESNPQGQYVIMMSYGDPPLYRFNAADSDDAQAVLSQWQDANPEVEDRMRYDWDPNMLFGQPPGTGQSQQTAAQSQQRPAARLTDPILAAPESNPDANWAIVRNDDDAVIDYFTRNTPAEAETAFNRWIERYGQIRRTNYRLEPVEPRTTSAQTQPAAQTEPQANWTSRNQLWRILINGEEVHNFWNTNVQSDANQAAHTWVLDQIRRGLLSPAEGAEVEVIPMSRNTA